MEWSTTQTEKTANQPADVGAPPTKPGPPPPSKRRRRLQILTGVGAIILVAGVIAYYLLFIAPYENTDDAFIEGHVTFVSPRVSGQVIRLLVHDNQRVQEGDLMVEIDPSDIRARVAQARANLASAQSQLEQARAQVGVDEAKVQQQKAAVTAVEAEALCRAWRCRLNVGAAGAGLRLREITGLSLFDPGGGRFQARTAQRDLTVIHGALQTHSPSDPPGEPHSHSQRHEELTHSHPHYPDIHHRHGH